ncbi:MAG: hypothetical protein AAGC63_11460 [Propionicimonas sp.]|nr:hypothetical protein [Propionicimonas sp.]
MARLHPTTPAAALATLALLALAGCQPAAPSATPVTPASATATPSPSTTLPARDLTRPGEALRMLDSLLEAAGSGQLIMVELTAETASISVLPSGSTEPVTWAYRDGRTEEVASDLQYVDQASFTLDGFDVSDLGRLFRVASAISGSTHKQTLQIVDYSGGRVVMAVTTNPESRTVFFNPDGSLLPDLDYHSLRGITEGLDAVVEDRVTVQAVGIESAAGAWVDYADSATTTTRRQRPAKVPVTTLVRDEALSLPPFAAARVRPDAVWRVLQRTIQADRLDADVEWSVTVDDRADAGAPRMYFTIGTTSLVTDLAGTEVTPT